MDQFVFEVFRMQGCWEIKGNRMQFTLATHCMEDEPPTSGSCVQGDNRYINTKIISLNDRYLLLSYAYFLVRMLHQNPQK